jgi:hypothetical protein
MSAKRSAAMYARPIQKAERPRAVTTFVTKLKIIKNVEADLRCHKGVLTEKEKSWNPANNILFSRR